MGLESMIFTYIHLIRASPQASQYYLGPTILGAMRVRVESPALRGPSGLQEALG